MKNKILISGLAFALIMAISMISIKSFEEGQINIKIVVSAIIGASIGALVFSFFMKFAFKKIDKIQIEVPENETILKEGLANHKLNYERVGGKLFLTNKRLIFKSHKMNIQNHTFEIELASIKDCSKQKTMRIFSNGFKIITKDNLIEKFVVHGHREWIKMIAKAINIT